MTDAMKHKGEPVDVVARTISLELSDAARTMKEISDFATQYEHEYKPMIEEAAANCRNECKLSDFKDFHECRVAKTIFKKMSFTVDMLHGTSCDWKCYCDKHCLMISW